MPMIVVTTRGAQTMSYTWMSDAELLRVAEDSDSELARELAVRLDKLIAAHEELLEENEFLRDERDPDDDDDGAPDPDTRPHFMGPQP